MRFTKIVMAAAALAITAAGCGGGDDEESKGGQAKSRAAEQVSQITVWRLGDPLPELKKFHEEVDAAFTAEHPGVTVNVQWIPWNDYANKFQAAVAGGTGPDVTEVGNTDVLGWAGQGAFEDITSKVNGWADAKNIGEGAWSNDRLGGKTYAVPWYVGGRQVYYRKDWFADLGLRPPTSWQEMVDAAKTIQREKGAEVAGFHIPVQADATFSLAPFIWGNGGEIATEQGGRWVSGVTSPQAKEAISYYTGLVTKEKVSPEASAERDNLKIQSEFIAGRVGMFIGGNWDKSAIAQKNEKLEKDIGVFPLPRKTGGVAPVFGGGSDLAIWQGTRAPNLSWEYVQHLLSKENATKYADAAGFFPAFTDLLNSPKYQNDEFLSPFAKGLAAAKSVPATPNWVEVNQNKTVLQTMLRDIITGKKSVDDATADAAAQMDELLNQ